ncbi:hypothetical protein Tsubulata_003468 [Turnera subulata]|uniref:Alpha/beta hydrolase fold-3 domain-containing protein n=1 Tax=Turnera subulata TaxID=218843 RepID=A0A9Q0G7V4_9ROSI|nr:hypothetical protein Tsubulata_003468 [Turnera subulata]
MSENEIAKELLPLLRVYKDGRVDRLMGEDIVPPGDPKGVVLSKDVLYSPEANLSSRLYLPKNTNPGQKLPLLIYIHGGGFCIESAFSPTYHNHLNFLVPEANVIAVSVEYRRAPENILPAAYDDSWAAIKWAASHVNGNGPEEWLNSHADFDKVFVAGDSAGANITHQMGLRLAQEKLVGFHVQGLVLVHPYFWGVDRIGKEPEESVPKTITEGLWNVASPGSGFDDPLFNPVLDPKFAALGSARLLVFVAGNDILRDRGWLCFEELEKRGWKGKVEIMESEGEDHVFHLFNPTSENANRMLQKFVSFFNIQA